MRFLVSVQAPKSSNLQANGDWLVEAEDREMALDVVQQQAVSSWWPSGSTWSVDTHSEDSRMPK